MGVPKHAILADAASRILKLNSNGFITEALIVMADLANRGCDPYRRNGTCTTTISLTVL
jgi:hypothetical protein